MIQLEIGACADVEGVEMGVLSTGQAYLTQSGLARMCGTTRQTLSDHEAAWSRGKRTGALAKLLIEAGIDRESLHLDLNKSAYAYPEDVCMVFLEYYAFESQASNAQAVHAYRKLARAGLRMFVYSALGYDPSNSVPLPWRQFHDRLALSRCPYGYFSVFKELSEFVLSAIRAGLQVDSKTIPDISVGLTWAKHWSEEALEERFGPRI